MKCIPDVRMLVSLCQMLQTFMGTCTLMCVEHDGACEPVRGIGDVFVEQTCRLQETLAQCTFPCREQESPSPPAPSWWWGTSPPAPPSVASPPAPSWWTSPPAPPALSPQATVCTEHGAPAFLQSVYDSQCPTAVSCEECTQRFQYCKWGEGVTELRHCSSGMPFPPPGLPPPPPPPAPPPPPGCQEEDAPPLLESLYAAECPGYTTCTACIHGAQFCAWHGAHECS
jgi:hypothetical protein